MGRYWVTSGNRHLASDEWLTPPKILKELGPFDLDPCAPINRPWEMAKKHYTLEDDGLRQPWEGYVWVNPPYGRGLDKWIIKAAEHGNGIALFPLRSTDSSWFHLAVWNAATAVFFVKGRIKFYSPEGIEGGPCPHASIMVGWGEVATEKLTKLSLHGHLIR